MLATISFIFGIFLAVIILAVARRREPEAGSALKPTALGWCTLASGLTAVTSLAVAMWLSPRSDNSGTGLFLVSITFAFAAVVIGIGTLIKHDRHWPTWAGLIAGLVPAIFWILFTAGNILSSGDY